MFKKIKKAFVVQPNLGFVSTQHSRLSEQFELPVTASAPRSAASLLDAQTTEWAPASARRLRFVEGAIAVGVMGYFASGLAGALGVF